MKNKKTFIAVFSLQILVCLFLNWAGNRIISGLNWPVWLDSIGTVLAAWVMGPWCGAVVGATSNLLVHALYRLPWYYSLISILIAVIVGYASRMKKLETLLDVITTGAVMAVIVAAASYPISLILKNGDTGNTWSNAVIAFLGEAGVPVWISLFIGELYVEVPDKVLIMIILYLFIRMVKLIRVKISGRNSKADPPEKNGTSAAARATALLLAAGLGLSGAVMAADARAEEATEYTEVNYNDYVQTIYSSTNGLPCGEANDIAMTGDGIMWIGTYAGLYRYNGREFRWMDNFDSVRNVNCLYVDEEGRLWIGTNDNGLSIVINGQVVNVIDQSMGLPTNAVKDIVRSSDGYYYIGTTGSMQILTLNSGLKKLNTLSEVAYTEDLAADNRGNAAAVTNDGTLFLMQEGQIVSSRQLPERQTVFRSCVFDNDGYLLAATSGNEIYRFDVSRGWFETVSVSEYAGLTSIKNMYLLDCGGMFICADNGIAFISPAGEYERINTNEFNNSIDNMLMDYQGNLWFTSSRLGLLRLAPSDFRDIYTTAGMEKQVVNTVVCWNNAYYIGTDKGMDAVDLKGMHPIRDKVTERFGNTRIRCMMVDEAGALWVCTYGSGLVEICADGTEYVYNRDNGAFGNRARVVSQLRDGTVLAAGDTGLSFIRDHRVERTITYTEGEISSMVLTITELKDGTILAGTDGNGLAVIADGEVEQMLTRADGLSSEVILRTVRDPKTGGVFVVTSNGLCYMDINRTIRTLDNFPYFNNYDIWIKGLDNLFVLSSAGIYTVDRDELLSGAENISYDLLDSRRGLNSSLTANSWTWFDDNTGDLYLACDTGVFVINTETFSSGASAYRMSVPTIRIDGKSRQVDRSIVQKIPRGATRLEILPEVINYTIQDPNVGYMLEGFDTDWTIVAQNALGTITYMNLPAKDYTFRLAVFDNNMKLVNERRYYFTKERAIYDSRWFIVYLLSIPLLSVGWLSWLLVSRHERRIEQQLETANRQVEMGKQTVIAIARTVDAKDQRTSDHSRRVAIYSRQIAEAYGLDKKQCQDIEWTAQMHDIGKIGIPDSILNKPARLTDEEYATMKTHTTRGAEILKDFTLLDNVIDGAEYHHERYDGRGYPKGLKGEEIPLFARIIGVADAFDAMTANRIYRQKMDFSYVLGEMERGRGTQFDPKCVDILLKLIADGRIDLNEIYNVPKTEEARPEAEKAPQENAEGKAPEKEKTEQAEPAQNKPEEGSEA